MISCQTISFSAAEAAQDPGDDGWYGLAPIDVNPQVAQPKYVGFGNTFLTIADGQTMTAASQDWVGPSTDDLAVQTTTITSDTKPVATTVKEYAQFIDASTTIDGKPATATSLMVTPEMLSTIDNVREQALSTCPKKVKRQACILDEIGLDKSIDMLRTTVMKQGINLGTKLLSALVAVHLLTATAKTVLNENGNLQFVRPLNNAITDIPSKMLSTSSASSTEPAIIAWTDPQYIDIDAILAMSITAETSPSLFCSAMANRPAAISSTAHPPSPMARSSATTPLATSSASASPTTVPRRNMTTSPTTCAGPIRMIARTSPSRTLLMNRNAAYTST